MIKFKDYTWVLDGLAALLLLVAFIFMIINGADQVGTLVIQFTGLGILFFTLMRVKPIISSRNEKDYVLVMFVEILLDIAVGIMLLAASTYVESSDIFSFSRLLGLALFIRGVCHFWTTSKRYEMHDIISFIVHVVFMSFGFLFLYSNQLDQKNLAYGIIILSILLAVYFTYRSYNGYNHYRIQKGNSLKMGDYLEKDEKKVIEDPKTIEEKINPKKIEEPKPVIEEKIEEPNDDNRPSIDIN